MSCASIFVARSTAERREQSTEGTEDCNCENVELLSSLCFYSGPSVPSVVCYGRSLCPLCPLWLFVAVLCFLCGLFLHSRMVTGRDALLVR